MASNIDAYVFHSTSSSFTTILHIVETGYYEKGNTLVSRFYIHSNPEITRIIYFTSTDGLSIGKVVAKRIDYNL